MPTTPNTHGSAGAVTEAPRVAYVDNDAVVPASLRAPGLRAGAAPVTPA